MSQHYLSDDIRNILIALAIGTVIGAEREYRSKSAGLRTMILVSLGSCLFTILSVRIGSPGSLDRIAANIVTGIGFLGAGVIFKDESRVAGITTSTTIWMTAALGMAAGSGHYQAAMVSFAAVLIVLILLNPIQNLIERLNRTRSYRLTVAYKEETLEKYETIFRQHNLRFTRGKQSRIGEVIIGNWIIDGPDDRHQQLVKHLLNDPDIKEFDF